MLGKSIVLTSLMWAAPKSGTVIRFYNRSYKVVRHNGGLTLRRTAWQACLDFLEDAEDRIAGRHPWPKVEDVRR